MAPATAMRPVSLSISFARLEYPPKRDPSRVAWRGSGPTSANRAGGSPARSTPTATISSPTPARPSRCSLWKGSSDVGVQLHRLGPEEFAGNFPSFDDDGDGQSGSVRVAFQIAQRHWQVGIERERGRRDLADLPSRSVGGH